MLSRERAEFMIEKLEKELTLLQERKDSVLKNGNGNLDEINSRIEKVKESLNSFKDELIKMTDEDFGYTVVNQEEINTKIKDFEEEKEKYKNTSLWNKFVTGLQNKKINYQKIKNNSQNNKVGRM